MNGRDRRVLWILGHKTLTLAEVPSLESIGLEVFVPSRFPSDRSVLQKLPPGIPSRSTLDGRVKAILRKHNFYEDPWTHDVTDALNTHFSAVITSAYRAPLENALGLFEGSVMMRVFGRESPRNYSEILGGYNCAEKAKAAGNRFFFAQAYQNLADIEDPWLQHRAYTVGCGLPESMHSQGDSWSRKRKELLIHCPNIDGNAYYQARYKIVNEHFSDRARFVMGNGSSPTENDNSILGYISDRKLVSLYRSCSAFIYPSTEPRHLHYSPIEAINIGIPTLYLKGSMLAVLAGRRLPGECTSFEQLKEKAVRLQDGDIKLQAKIVKAQKEILRTWKPDFVRDQWQNLFTAAGSFPFKPAE